MDGFNGISDIIWVEDLKMMKDKQIGGKKVVSRFKGNLIKMIRKVNSRFDDYTISPKIREILLQWGYELTESDLH